MKAQRWTTLCCPHCGIHSRREAARDDYQMGRSYPIQLSSQEPLSEAMSMPQNYKVSQGDTKIWVLTQESQPEDISELPCLTPAATMESRCRTAKQVSESFPAQEKKMGQRKWKGWSPVETLFRPDLISDGGNYRNMRLKSYSIQARNYWRDLDEKNPTLRPPVSIQMANKLEPLLAHSETHSIRAKRAPFPSLKETQKRALSWFLLISVRGAVLEDHSLSTYRASN